MLPLLPAETYMQRYYRQHKEYFKEVRKRKTPEQKRREKLKSRYGLTVEQYGKLNAKQKGLCVICNRTNNTRRLCVDHNHKTGKVRGLLCSQCNFFIERIESDYNTFKRLENYIESSTFTE